MDTDITVCDCCGHTGTWDQAYDHLEECIEIERQLEYGIVL